MKYPNLSSSKIISFDTETKDPNLIKHGPGVYRKDGHILGVAIANEQGFAEYYNLGHIDGTKEEKRKNKRYIKDVLKLPVQKLGANILYDMDWLENWDNNKVNGQLHDIQVAEPLLDENRKELGISHPYSLDSLAQKYLNKNKYKTEIDAFCEKHNLKGDPRQYLYLMPYKLVRKYAIEDVLLPIQIFKKQWAVMHDQQLLYLYEMEMSLFRLLLQMRKTGVRIDPAKIDQGVSLLETILKKGKRKLYEEHGDFNHNSSKQIAKVFDSLNIKYPLTAKGNPHLDKHVLEQMKDDHPFINDLLSVRKADKLIGTFFKGSYQTYNINNRIHCLFYPLSTDKFGAKSGRFSGAKPNLQQEPSDKVYGPICRSVFIPEEDHDWVKLDYSQIEYRFIAHYARGEKSKEVREKYNNDPTTDYHRMIMEWTGLDRKRAKNLNFGAGYFMGVKTCANEFNWTLEESKNLLEMYHNEVPFIKETREHVVRVGRQRGYIRTILNRRARVTPLMRQLRKEHSLFNRLIQGSAADLMKKGMSDAYKAGIFNVLIPHLTVHDEIDVSKPRTKEGDEAVKELIYIMENAIKLKVPIKVDAEIGPNWGELKDYE
jgi:DNA polymerase-1